MGPCSTPPRQRSEWSWPAWACWRCSPCCSGCKRTPSGDNRLRAVTICGHGRTATPAAARRECGFSTDNRSIFRFVARRTGRRLASPARNELRMPQTHGPVPRPAGTPRHFHVLAKPTGAICNLDCKYCFFLSKEMLYPGDRFRMADDLLDIYIRQLLESRPGPEISVAWQGGEPTLMGLPFFRRAMDVVGKYRRPGMTIEHTIQTNGTELTGEWCEFFRDNRFLVGLSMDGPREMHD